MPSARDDEIPAMPPPSDGSRTVVAAHTQHGAYTNVVCTEGSLWRWRWRWRKVKGWSLLAVVPGSGAHAAVERDGLISGYTVQPEE